MVKALDERFATDYTVNIIAGRLTPAGVDVPARSSWMTLLSATIKPHHYWNSLVRQMLLENLLSKDIVEYGVLKITKQGEAFAKEAKSFPIVMNNLFEEANADDEEAETTVETAAVDNVLFEQLMDLRLKEAKKKALPPFVIFLENSLQDMATMYPTTIQELEKCQGVSKGKALRHGKPFVDMVAKYVEEHDVQKPDDFVMKSVANKSMSKVFIIQQVDKKMPLEVIAKNKDWRMDALMEEMETIAASGTKLNLDYAIDDMLDEYEQEEIIDYFKGCETSSLQVAQQELNEGNYSWEQLKIMRIKFLSEYGM